MVLTMFFLYMRATKAIGHTFPFNRWDATRFPVLNLSFRVTPHRQRVMKMKTAKETNIFSWFTIQLVYKKLWRPNHLQQKKPFEGGWFYTRRVSTPSMLLQMNWTDELTLKTFCTPQKTRKKNPSHFPMYKEILKQTIIAPSRAIARVTPVGVIRWPQVSSTDGRLQARCRLVYSKKAADWDLFGSGWTSVFPELILACNSV